MKKSLLNKIFQWSLVGLISFILLEVSLHFLAKAGVLYVIMPTYQLNDSEDFISERSFIYGRRHHQIVELPQVQSLSRV